MANEAKSYRFIGSHADQLSSGRPITPGEFLELTDEELREPHNEQLAADGLLLGIDKPAEHQVDLAQRRELRRTRVEGDPDNQEEGERT